jgi:hypothetical protein
MWPFKVRPQVRLRLYPEVYPGQTFDVAVLLDSSREVSVERVDVTFRGLETSWGNPYTARQDNLIELAARVSGPCRLAPGRTELACRIPLPADLPPTYDGRAARTRYELWVHVAMRAWLDRRERFPVKVALPRGRGESGAAIIPTRFTSSRTGPRDTEPYLEGSLASKILEPGGVLSGAVALSNTAHNRYRSLFVSLIAQERDPRPASASGAGTEVKRFELELSLSGLREGQPLPFHMEVPSWLFPSYRSRVWELCWFVEVRAEVSWRGSLRFLVPVKVLSRPRVGLGPQIRVPPSIGSPRIQEIWRQVAESSGLGFSDDGLRGMVAGVQVEVRRERRGRRGNYLLGELRYPTLGIDLRVHPLTGLERYLGERRLSLGDAAWDRRSRIEGRDPVQVRAFGERVVETLFAFTAVHMEDELTRVERRGSGHDRRVLEQFTSNVLELAEAIERGRQSIPPPPEMEQAVPSWEQLARRVHGTLNRANMSVEGTIQAMRVAVATVWSERGEVRHTRLEVFPTLPIAGRFAASLGAATGGEPLTIPPLPDYPAESRELVAIIVDGAEAFSMTADRAVLLLPAPLLEPAPLVATRLEWMVQLCLSLGKGGGPYR